MLVRKILELVRKSAKERVRVDSEEPRETPYGGIGEEMEGRRIYEILDFTEAQCREFEDARSSGNLPMATRAFNEVVHSYMITLSEIVDDPVLKTDLAIASENLLLNVDIENE